MKRLLCGDVISEEVLFREKPKHVGKIILYWVQIVRQYLSLVFFSVRPFVSAYHIFFLIGRISFIL